MKSSPVVFALSSITLVFAGCAAPAETRALHRQNREAVQKMHAAYGQDFGIIKAGDLERARMMRDVCVTLQARIIAAHERSFTEAKRAAVLSLYQEFDEAAWRVVTHEFWIANREMLANPGARDALVERMNQIGQLTQATQYPKDKNAENGAFLAFRQMALADRAGERVQEAYFAKWVDKLEQARREFRGDVDTAFAALKFDTTAEQKELETAINEVLNDTAMRDAAGERAASYRAAADAVDNAMASVDSYLDGDGQLFGNALKTTMLAALGKLPAAVGELDAKALPKDFAKLLPALQSLSQNLGAAAEKIETTRAAKAKDVEAKVNVATENPKAATTQTDQPAASKASGDAGEKSDVK